MKSVLLLMLRGYQYMISPMLGQNCRFYPSCSEYAVQAIQEYGAVKGSLMAGKRLCKCHPWHEGGVDLMPLKDGIHLKMDDHTECHHQLDCDLKDQLDCELHDQLNSASEQHTELDSQLNELKQLSPVSQTDAQLEMPASVTTSVAVSSKPS